MIYKTFSVSTDGTSQTPAAIDTLIKEKSSEGWLFVSFAIDFSGRLAFVVFKREENA